MQEASSGFSSIGVVPFTSDRRLEAIEFRMPFNPELDFGTLEFWWDSGVSDGSDFHDDKLSLGGKPEEGL